MSEKDRRKKDGGRKDKQNQTKREAESDPQRKEQLSEGKNREANNESSNSR